MEGVRVFIGVKEVKDKIQPEESFYDPVKCNLNLTSREGESDIEHGSGARVSHKQDDPDIKESLTSAVIINNKPLRKSLLLFRFLEILLLNLGETSCNLNCVRFGSCPVQDLLLSIELLI